MGTTVEDEGRGNEQSTAPCIRGILILRVYCLSMARRCGRRQVITILWCRDVRARRPGLLGVCVAVRGEVVSAASIADGDQCPKVDRLGHPCYHVPEATGNWVQGSILVRRRLLRH